MASAIINEPASAGNIALSVETLPSIVYRDHPVVTTKALAALYGTAPVNIRRNLSANKDRFTVGKHFFRVEGDELRRFKECVTSGNAFAIPQRGGVLTLWTSRGAARHAKMLDTDKAWDVFELLEENYFSRRPVVTEPVAPTTATSRLTTAKERNALTGLVNRYVGLLPGGPNPEAYKAAYAKIHDVMGVKSVEELTVEQLPRAVGFMQSLLDMVGKIAVPALPETPEILPATMESQIQRLRSLKQEMLDLGTDVYRAVKRNLRPRACDHGKPTGSLVVNMNYMLDDVFYALDRNLDAIEHLCVAGELARRVFPESHHTR